MDQGGTENQKYQECMPMCEGVPLDLGSPRLATDIPYSSSSPVRDTSEADFSFGNLFCDDLGVENRGLFMSLSEFLREPSVTHHNTINNQKAVQLLETPPSLTQAQLREVQDERNTERVSGVTPPPTEAKLRETQGNPSSEGLPDMPLTPAQTRLEEAWVKLSPTIEHTVLNPPPQPGSNMENTHLESAPRLNTRPEGQTPYRIAPAAPSDRSRSHDLRATATTKDTDIPEPPMKQPQINTTGVTMYYHSMEEAEKAMSEHFNWNATDDDTVPKTNKEKTTLVAELFLAMTDTSHVPETEGGSKKPQAIRTFEEGKYLDWQIQIVCWRILEQCIQRQRLGPLVPPWQRMRKPKEYDNFKWRFNATCEALKCEKQLCKRLMAANLIDDFVDDPTSYVKRIQQNKSLNDKKKDQIKLGRAAQAATIPNILKRAGRKRKVTDLIEEIGGRGRKRTRRTKLDTELQGDQPLAESFQVAGSSQVFVPPLPLLDYSFPLDPALSQEVPNEEWLNWVNYGPAFLTEGTTFTSPMLGSSQFVSGDAFPPRPFPHSTVNYQPSISGSVLSVTDEQVPTGQHGGVSSGTSHHVPHHHVFSEEEEQQTGPGRKRRRMAGD